MPVRAFDLNIEEVLENWEVEHALREVIANALDEQLLSKTAEIQITKNKDGTWRISDFGRGLQIEHFTLKENPEKISALSGVIGKFGVGLKDALATFHRRRIGVVIRSRHGTYRLAEEAKHGFEKIRTLHVEYDDTPIDMRGTEFVLNGVKDETVAKAKALFLRFAGEETIETTSYGQILRHRGGAARVYILGLLASEELNFLFSYNIVTSDTYIAENALQRLDYQGLKRLKISRRDLSRLTLPPLLRGLPPGSFPAALSDAAGACRIRRTARTC